METPFKFEIIQIYTELKRINNRMLINDEDYAQNINYVGYNKGDTMKAHGLADTLCWREHDAIWIYEALGRYRNQLMKVHGIDFNTIQKPYGMGNEGVTPLKLSDLDKFTWSESKYVAKVGKVVQFATNLPEDVEQSRYFWLAFEELFRLNSQHIKWDLGFSMEYPNQWNNYTRRVTRWSKSTPPVEPIKKEVIVYTNTNDIKLKYESYLLPYQPSHVKNLLYAFEKNNHQILDGSDTGTGKCVKKGTLIRMFNGSLKKVEDIKIGDLIMGDDSTPRTILSLANGIDDMYEIIPNDLYSEPFTCNKEHVLVVKNSVRVYENGKYKCWKKITKEIAIKDFLRQSKTIQNRDQLYRVGVEYPEKEVLIDPYWLGLWLGDGTESQPGITTMDSEIKEYIQEYAKQLQLHIQTNYHKNNKSNSHYIRKENNKPKLENCLLNNLKRYNLLNNKHIPIEYLINSRKIRLQLLAGLIDSDGYKEENGCYEIIQKREQLIYDIKELVRSLGYSCYIIKIQKGIKKLNFVGDYFKLCIKGANDIPCKLKRKQSTPRQQIKDPNVSTFKVRYLSKGEYFGFTLSGNGRYLLKDYTVTHNTFTAIALAMEKGLNLFIVCPISLIPTWVAAMKHFGILETDINSPTGKHFIVNYELLRLGKMIHFRYSKKQTTYGTFKLMYDKVQNPFLQYLSNTKYIWSLPKTTLLVYDEVQRCKNPKTANSATLVAAKEADLNFLGMSATIGENPLKFRATGFMIGLFDRVKDFYNWSINYGCGGFGFNGSWAFDGDPQHMKKLNSEIFEGNKRGARMAIADLGNLFPETQITAELYNMNSHADKIQEVYERMEAEVEKLAEAKEHDYANVLTVLLRARQEVELLKMPTLIDLTEDYVDSGSSVVIFVNFNQTVDSLSELLKTKCVIRGGQKMEDRQHYIEEFQADRERVIICNINAGGVGISLHDMHGNHPRISLICPNFSAQDLLQAKGRIWRGSAKSKAIQRIIFCANTVEEQICETVRKKIINLNLLNDGDLSKGLNINPIYIEEANAKIKA